MNFPPMNIFGMGRLLSGGNSWISLKDKIGSIFFILSLLEVGVVFCVVVLWTLTHFA